LHTANYHEEPGEAHEEKIEQRLTVPLAIGGMAVSFFLAMVGGWRLVESSNRWFGISILCLAFLIAEYGLSRGVLGSGSWCWPW